MSTSKSTADAPSYFRYWGKASKTEPAVYHLLPYHCLDTAAVGAAWLDADKALLATFVRAGKAPPEIIRPWILFFLALHDLGKFDIRFQLKLPGIAVPLNLLLRGHRLLQESIGFPHGQVGYEWFLNEMEGHGFSTTDPDGVSDWMWEVARHHGVKFPKNAPPSDILADPRALTFDRQARREWVQAAANAFLRPAGLFIGDNPPAVPPLLPGFCCVCDWVASNEDWFPYLSQDGVRDVAAYWEKAREFAAQAVESAGLCRPAAKQGGIALVMPKHPPRGLQLLVDQWPVSSGLTVIEAPTGSGKTEAALAHASRLLADGLAGGIVYALPTQATANAMFQRLERIAPRLFPGVTNAVLAHGKARFNPLYDRIKKAGVRPIASDEEDGLVQCAQWLSQSRKRVFLGQICVCTIDQVLLSVLPVRHYFVRGFGVGRNVLIVDEVHAYDRYMDALLDYVLDHQRRAGGSAVLLSATLTSSRRAELIEKWQGTRPCVLLSDAYPLATITDAPTPRFFHDTSNYGAREVRFRVEERENMAPDERLLAEALDKARSGARVAVVCNLVDVAQATARCLRAAEAAVPVDLFHARFRFKDRQTIEARTLGDYGESRGDPAGRILVATQVVEQSLDLDFDWMATQLCPVDLVFQRVGRLHRHERPRPPCASTPECVVLAPENTDFGVHKVIYQDPRALWRTQTLLKQPPGVARFPAAYRDWIERVYREQAWPDEPEEIVIGHAEFDAEVRVRHMTGVQVAVSDMNLWQDTDDRATALTRYGDKSLNIVPVVLRGGKECFLDSETAIADLDAWERVEALSLNTIPVPYSWRKWLPKAREGIYYLPMTPIADGVWQGSGEGMDFTYSRDYGLEKGNGHEPAS